MAAFSRLIKEFISGKTAVYYLADLVSEQEHLKNLGRTLGEYFKDSILSSAGFSSWQQFFHYLKEKHPKRVILVIDEFPYLVSSNPAISSIFQKGMDEYLKETDIFLVLMGSSVFVKKGRSFWAGWAFLLVLIFPFNYREGV